MTIIKSTLSNLPTYYLSLFSIPMGVPWHIEKLKRDFQWHGIEDELKFNLVNWRTVCASLSSDGLPKRNLVQFNHALSGKNASGLFSFIAFPDLLIVHAP